MDQFLSSNAVWITLIVSIIGIAFALRQQRWVLAQPTGNEKMNRIAGYIQRGAAAFLQREFRAVAILMGFIFIVLTALSFLDGDGGMTMLTPISYLAGGLISGITGYSGMYIAVRANVRTTQAASESLNKGLRVAFSSGSVMGISVVSLGLFGISLLYIIFHAVAGEIEAANGLTGFSFGAATIAIFARVGGGIFTKAADVGADLVGKTEAGIPEDDPRNPAVIADNVGDNVGDVAGMGSDLFESYVSSIIATLALAASVGASNPSGVAFPFLIGAAGLLISIWATTLVKAEENSTQQQLLGALRKGVYAASGGVTIAIIVLGLILFGGDGLGIIIATLSGLAAGVAIGYFTEYYTSDTYKPTMELSESSQSGPGIVIIRGISLGMQSTIAPIIVVVTATILAYSFGGIYGVAVSAVGMLATLGITLSTDAYGPVADNAGGIAEMAELGENVRNRTDALDSLGNTTAATGKGFAIGSAAMTALALIAAFVQIITPGINIIENPHAVTVSILDLRLITGLFIGGLLPFAFSALTMLAVGKAAGNIVQEVRRQFREIPGLMEGKAEPDYEKCVAISTDSAIRQMIMPGVIAVLVPVTIAILARLFRDDPVLSTIVGIPTLLGLLLGSLVSGFLLAVMMSNAGGAWDNAKKYIERGHYGGKKSEPHKAAVVGDTVGDPFKDTSGPSLNILIKVVTIVCLVIAPFLTA